MTLDYKKYIDGNGLLSGNGLPSGNGVLYTSELAILLTVNGQAIPQELKDALGRCAVHPPFMGLLKRSPINADHEAFDDYIGLCALSHQAASQVLNYARNNFWCFNEDENWKLSSDSLGRSPSFRAHVRACAAEPLSVVETLAWCFAVMTAGPTQDSWILSGLLCLGASQKNWMMRIAAWVYETRLEHAHGTLGKVFKAYFGKEDHPLNEWGFMDYVKGLSLAQRCRL